jgi:hypothetical protein
MLCGSNGRDAGCTECRREKMSGFPGLERSSRLRGCAGAHGWGEPSPTPPSAEFVTGSLSPRRRTSNGKVIASAAQELHLVATSLKIRFKLARGFLCRPSQIECAHKFSTLVHEIDNSSMIHRIVAGLLPKHLFRIYTKGTETIDLNISGMMSTTP